jgi:hypothetical protein
MALDTEQIARGVLKQAIRCERLRQNLSRLVGSIPDDVSSSLEDLARYGLQKLNIEIPADDESPCVVAIETYLRGAQKHGMGPGSTGMDSAGDSFVDRYIRGEVSRGDAGMDAGESSLDRYINSPGEDV